MQELELVRCDCSIIHEETVAKVRGRMPADETLYDLAELFKVFGDTTRVKLLYALDQSQMCVCDLAVLHNKTKSAVSQQLRMLKTARLVKYRREGKIVYYTLDDDHIRQIFELGMTHVGEFGV